MEHDASLETTQPVSSISRISKVSTSPQPLQKKVRNSGISEDFGVNRSNVIGSPQ